MILEGSRKGRGDGEGQMGKVDGEGGAQSEVGRPGGECMFPDIVL